MLNITYITNTLVTLSQFPEQWREYVTVLPVRIMNNALRYRVTIGVQPDDAAYRYRALMEARQLVLKFSLPFFWEFPVGSTVMYDNEAYFVKRPEDIKKQGSRNIEYSMTLYAEDSNLADYKFRNPVDGRLKWSACAKPHEFIEYIVANINERESTDIWTVGDCIDANEKTIEFNHTYLFDALQSIADTFETEFEITDEYKINLKKVEYNKDDDEPLQLSYGRGNGFVPGVGRTSETDGEPIKRLYVQGSDENINRDTYGDLIGLDDKPGELLLPLSQQIEYEGHTYQSDEHGYYIERVDEISTATKDDSLDCSEIYPSRYGRVTSIPEMSESDIEKNFFDFVDDTIPENLDFNAYIIPGETMTVRFQTGMLAGDKEFEVKYIHNSVNGKAARRFEIVPQEIDGITMPNKTYLMKADTDSEKADGDTYAVFGIQLPKEYICDDDSQTGASWDMMRAAARKLYECENQKFTFTGELQSMWAKRNWEKIGAKIRLGGYVLFTDNQFARNGELIRIVGIKEYLTKPYAPTIELSNSVTTTSSVSSSLNEIANTEVIINDTKNSILQFTKRRFRDAKETIAMLEDAQLSNFTSAVSPVAVQTMAMLVGDESLQFEMGATYDTIGSDDYQITFDGTVLNFPSGFLRHMTIDVNTITADRETTDYRVWRMPAEQLTPKDDSKYYVYAVVNRTGFAEDAELGVNINETVGTWLIDTVSHRIDEDPNTYHLLAGVLNSEYMGSRSFATLYGFTEILPGRMTTDLIVSNDGKTYMNLKTGEIGGNIKFLSDDDSYITIIEGGKIKSELLDVTKIIAQSVIVGEEGKQRVEIVPDDNGNGSIKIYDEDNTEVSSFEGKAYNALTELYDANTGGDCTILSRESASYGDVKGVTLGRGQQMSAAFPTATLNTLTQTIPISDVFYSSAPTEITIKQGHLHATATAASVTVDNSNDTTSIIPYANSSAQSNIEVKIQTYKTYDSATGELSDLISSRSIASTAASALGSKALVSTSPIDNGNGTITYPGMTKDSGWINIAGTKLKVDAGYHRLVIYVSLSTYYSGSTAVVQWGNYQNTGYDDIMASYKNDAYVSRFFANGFCLGTRSDNYIMAWRTSDGMRFIMENNELGFDFSKSGIRTRAKGTNWLPLPLLLYKASYYYNKSADTPYQLRTEHGYLSFNGDTLPATRRGTGLVTLTFPDSWLTDLGEISVKNLLVQVNAQHQTIDARVESISTSAVLVAMSDDASKNDGDFGIVIYYLPS